MSCPQEYRKVHFPVAWAGSLRLGVLVLLIVSISGLAFGGCGEEPTPGPPVTAARVGSPIAVAPCPLPCWYGIVPGETSAERALLILQSLPGGDEITLHRDGYGKLIYIDWHAAGWAKTGWYPAGDRKAGVFLTVKDGVVTQILITLAISQSLSLGEVVKQYGDPEAYSTQYVGSVEGEPEYWAVVLFYPTRGFVVSVMASAPLKGRVTPDLQVTHIRSFVAVTLEEYFAEGRSPYETPDAKEWEEWRGFYDEGLP